MESLRQIEQQIEQIRDLYEIVQTMRTLASTYLKRAEERLEPIRLYHRIVVRALSLVLPPGGNGSSAEGELTSTANETHFPAAVVLFATEQGLCGRFNEVMAEVLGGLLGDLPGRGRVVVIGQRGRVVVENAGIEVHRAYPGVTSPEGIPGAVRRTAEELLALYDRGEVRSIHLLHAVHQSVGRFGERFERVLPLDPATLRSSEENDDTPHPLLTPRGFRRPLTYLPQHLLRRRLVEEYYFIRFHRAFLETVASENSVRLQSMEAAKANIEETLSELENRRRILRQDEITEELLDVISGAEAVRLGRRYASRGATNADG